MTTSTNTIQKEMTSTANNLGSLSSSMLHSLRHSDQHITYDKKGRPIENWDAEKVDQSFALINGEKVNLADLSDKEKDNLVAELLKPEFEDLSNQNIDKELVNQIEKQNELVLKKKSNLKRNGPLFKEFGELKDKHISDKTLEKFIDRVNSDDEIKRKNQKIKGLQDFQKMNNGLVEMRDSQQDFKMDKRKGLVQESFIKFPKMENGTIPDEKYCEILQDYYKENFPDYNIKASFFHGDEESLSDDLKDCGAHAHIFVSCKNNKSKQYDLVKQQKIKSINYIKENPQYFPDIEPDKLKISYPMHRSSGKPLTGEQKKVNRENSKYLSAIGQAKQKMMIDFSQEKLKDFDIKLYRNTYKSDIEKERLRQLEADKKLPKSQRVNNSYNQKIDKEKKELKYYKNKNEIAQDKNRLLVNINDELNNDINKKRDDLNNLDDCISEKKSILNSLTKQIDKAKSETKKFISDTKEYFNKFFNKSPKNGIEKQAEKTAKQSNNIVNAMPDSKESVSNALGKITEITSTGTTCIVCGAKSMFGGKCASCYANSDEYDEFDNELVKQAKLEKKLSKNKVGQGFVYDPTKSKK